MTSRHVWRYRAGTAKRPDGWWLVWVHEVTDADQIRTMTELRACVCGLEIAVRDHLIETGEALDVDIEWPSATDLIDHGTRLAIVVWERPRVMRPLESMRGTYTDRDEFTAQTSS